MSKWVRNITQGKE